jgi:hypothetical protein
MLAYLNKQASISCLLALLTQRGKQASATDRRQDKKPTALLSLACFYLTKGEIRRH